MKHPLRAYAHGDLSSNVKGRSGDTEVGAVVEGPWGDIYLTVDVDGGIMLTHRAPQASDTVLFTGRVMS